MCGKQKVTNMSDNTPVEVPTENVTIGGTVFPFTEITEPGRKSKKNPTPAPTIYVRPVLNGLDEHVEFVKSMLVAAGDKAVDLFDKLFVPHFKTVSDNGLYNKDGSVSLEKLPSLLVALRHSKSGPSLEDLERLKDELNAECLEILALVSLQRRDPAAYLAELEKQGLTEDQYVVKCLSVQQRLQDVQRAHLEAQQAKAARAANRAAKQAKDAGNAAV